jgi:hypothetical protein
MTHALPISFNVGKKQMSAMNDFDRIKRDCVIGIKALHSVRTAYLAFERLCSLADSSDHLLITSMFHLGVVKYAKPFTKSRSKTGVVCYPIKFLKRVAGFSNEVHKHLLVLRHKLVVHDDFEDIEARVLILNISVRPTKFGIPVRIIVANKSIAYPKDTHGASLLRDHAKATLSGIQVKLFNDLGKLRQVALDHPDQADAAISYSANYGSQNIEIGGTRLNFPDLSSNPWLSPSEPDFSTIHDGYFYETLRFNRDFIGPERITLPDGRSVEFTP